MPILVLFKSFREGLAESMNCLFFFCGGSSQLASSYFRALDEYFCIPVLSVDCSLTIHQRYFR